MKSGSLCNRYTVAASVICGVVLAGAALAGEGDSGKSPGSAAVTRMDTDRNGTVSASEHAAGAKAMFERMDVNGDGRVTAAEMDAAHAAMHRERGSEHAEHGGEDRHADSGEHRGPHRMSSAERIKVIDTNGDGVLTAEEHAAGSRSMFARMDTDHDGSLTAAEIKAGHEKMMNEGRQ